MLLLFVFALQPALASHTHFHKASDSAYTHSESSQDTSKKDSEGSQHLGCQCFHQSAHLGDRPLAVLEPLATEDKFIAETESPDFFVVQLLFRPPCLA